MATGKKLTEQGEIRFYEWLENKIAEEGSANKFCEVTGIRPADVSKYRKGNKAPTRYMVERMATSYNLSVEDIIGKDGIGADIIPRGDVTGLPKKKKKEPEGVQARNPMKITEDILDLARIFREQIMTVDQDIINLENEVRQLKIKKEHYEEIIRVFNDWRGIRHAD